MLKAVISSKRFKKTPVLNLAQNEQVVTKTKTNFRMFKSLKTLVTVIVLFFTESSPKHFSIDQLETFFIEKRNKMFVFSFEANFMQISNHFFASDFFLGPKLFRFLPEPISPILVSVWVSVPASVSAF